MTGARSSSADLDIKSVLIEGALVVVGIISISVSRWGWPSDSMHLLLRVLLITGIWQACLYCADLYSRRTMLDRELTIIGIVQAWCATIMTLAIVYYWFPSMNVARSVIVIALAILPLIAFIQRFIVDVYLRKQGTRERLLIVGTGEESLALARELHSRRNELALEIVGFVDPDPSRVGQPLFNPSIVGTFGDLSKVIGQGGTDRVAISTTSTIEEMSLDEIVKLRFSGVAFEHLSAIYEEYTGKVAIEALTPMALMSSAGFKRHSWLVAYKRAVDIVLSIIGLLITGPFMLVAALAIKLTSRGRVLYRQRRVGEEGRVFTMIKFRSMRDDAEKETGPVWASDNDTRVTNVGRLLRRTRFDELPQLWNVLRGDMSVVGPRPERPEIDVELLDQIPLYAHRRLVKPGITGWAQVRHAYVASMTDTRIKLQYDLFYIKNMSIALDFLIIMMTTKIVCPRHRRSMSAASATAPIVNALAVDLEDYYQVSAFDRIIGFDRWPAMEDRLSASTDRLLQLFDDFNVKATFFVLGWNAERTPAVMRRIAEAGHDVASHSYAHRLVYDLTPSEFRDDLRRAQAAIEDATGTRVTGFRAPSYSITARSLWALDVLVEEGYEFDSSIFPIRHDRYGIPGAARHPYEMTTAAGRLWEVPPTTVRMFGVNVPAAAGGYLRLLPFWWTRHAVRHLNGTEASAAVVSMHPWELDPDQPRVDVGHVARVRHYHNIDRTESRLRRLLREFRFAPIPNVLASLFPAAAAGRKVELAS